MSALASLPRFRPFGMEDDEFAARWADADDNAGRRRRRTLLWRRHLQAGVVAISPALLDMATARGVDLHRACQRLRPPARWSGPNAFGPLGWDESWPAPSPWRAPSRSGRWYRAARVVRARAVPSGHPDGMFAVAVDGRALSGCARVGNAELLTHGECLQLWFWEKLPEAVLAAAVGRRLDSLIDHAVVTGRPYRIGRVVDRGFATMIEAETGLVRFAMPWPDLLVGGEPGEEA